jgi:hypothetical protein
MNRERRMSVVELHPLFLWIRKKPWQTFVTRHGFYDNKKSRGRVTRHPLLRCPLSIVCQSPEPPEFGHTPPMGNEPTTAPNLGCTSKRLMLRIVIPL